MNNWFTVKVKYIKEFEDGTLKKVTEPYLIDSVSFTEAEARAYEEVGSYVRGEFAITGISKTDFADIYQYDDADTWYKSKIQIINVDADSGKEKKSAQNYLVSAKSISTAIERLNESLGSMMASFEVVAVSLTPLVDIFPFEGERELIEDEVETEEENEIEVVKTVSENTVDDEVEEEGDGELVNEHEEA